MMITRPTQLAVTFPRSEAPTATATVTGNAATAIIGVNAAVSTSIRPRPGGAMPATPPAAIRARYCSMYRSEPDTYHTVMPTNGVFV